MADPPPAQSGNRLDASGPRDVVYCHQCEHEWYQDEHGLTCPRCNGEATEIIIEENDPRSPPIPSREGLPGLYNHNPWSDIGAPDPEEGDIGDIIRERGGPGRTTFYSRTFHSNTPRGANNGDFRATYEQRDPSEVFRELQSLMGNIMGPSSQEDNAGRPRPENLFQPEYGFPRSATFATSRNGDGLRVVGGNIRFGRHMGGGQGNSPGAPPIDDFATYAPLVPSRSPGHNVIVIEILARPDQLARILGSLFGPAGGTNRQDGETQPSPFQGLRGLLDSIRNPANAVSGDAVFTQEALDRIISNLMEAHPTSNAPGPATAEAIASLPKKKLDEEMLGPELKADCSVCMDDVHLDDEVVVLPCKHWFHEACASAWLREHNTCPICRTGIGGDRSGVTPVPAMASPSSTAESSAPPNLSQEHATPNPQQSINEARLDYIRNRGRVSPFDQPETAARPRRHHVIGDPARQSSNRSPSPLQMPGGYGTTTGSQFRRRESEVSENQRDSRRRIRSSGSDRSRRSSGSGSGASGGSGGGGGGGGPLSWFSRRFSGGGSGNGNTRRE